jgi:prepilin-type N-terminal cleavage/methylation domain-containing protein
MNSDIYLLVILYNEIMKKGFTIIELIIVLAIISISATAGYVSYTRTFQSSTLKKDAQDFGNLISIAKDRTIRLDMTPNTACTQFRGYDVLLSTATVPHTYQLRFICHVGAADVYTPILPQYTLTTTNFFGVANGTRVPFYEPYGCVDSTPPDADCVNGSSTIKIQNPNITNQCITVTVNNLGVITVGDPGVCS